MVSKRKIRVLIAKPGLDPHDRGTKILAKALRDEGMEVIYIGLYQTPEAIVKTAIEEGVDIVCLSIHSGIHLAVAEKIMELFKENEAEDIPVICGGVIPDKDFPALKELKIKEVFGPRVPLSACIDYIKKECLKID
ncbi:MAG: cobalamin B12-binding domain-containing protein [Dehalococcoidales bacterium]|nr:cobalamin B12-binding domain-containing protein [Dehalococcoidales bacterium]